MFQIHEFTQAKLATLTSRAEKHGDDEVPAVSLGIELEAANTLLDTIDPKIRQALYVSAKHSRPARSSARWQNRSIQHDEPTHPHP